MNDLISVFLSFLLLYKYWALFVLGFSAAVILPIPMNTVLLAAGAFAGQGYFDITFSLIIAVFSNVAGDCFGYVLARMYGRRALHILRIQEPSYIKRFERYIKEHPGPTIFLTRFIGTIGSLANLLAGFIDMSFGAFLTYDMLGNLISIGGVLYAGYFLGIHWQDFSGLFDYASWVFIGCIALFFLAIWYRRGYKSNK